MARPTRRFHRKSRKTRKSHKQRKMRGGTIPDWIQPVLAEAVQIQTLATSMDEYNQPFLIAGSTAVAAYLHELLTTDVGILAPTEVAEGQAIVSALKKPDDLDFKYRRQGHLFGDHIQSTQSARNAPVTNKGTPTLDLSFLYSSTDASNCEQYVDIAGFRCCEPLEESPIFKPLQAGSVFSKVEFNPPHQFKRKRMHKATIAGLDLLGIEDLLTLYTSHPRSENAPKIAAIEYIQQTIEAHPELAEKYVGE